MSFDCRKQVIVVGAGIGGLTTAVRLAAIGYRVRVFESQPQVGGKLNRIKIQGFSFDTGPSLITMPGVLHDLFQAVGRRLEEYLHLIPLDITCRYFYRDGLVLNAWHNQARLINEFAHLNVHDGAALLRFTDYARAMYQAAADPFLYHSLGSPLDVLRSFMRYVWQGHDEQDNSNGSKARRNRLRTVLDALSSATLDQRVREFFVDPHLRQLFDRYATYNGSSPYRIASVYSIIPYIEMADGGWYPCGGIYTIAEALAQLARELGVCIETSCRVRRILVERGAARGVVLEDGSVQRSEVVVANSDVVTTYRELLSPAVRDERYVRRLERLEPSCSGFVLLLGVNKRYPELAHHNIFFSNDYPGEFEDLFTRHMALRNPTIYICAASRTDATQAPAGHENLFILVNAPYLTVQSNWQRDARDYRDHILDLLEKYPQIDLSDIREHVVCETILTPENFRLQYGSNAGSIYGLSSNQRLAPFVRPDNRARGIRHLYFVGGSTHPGGGVPLVMLSGKIVAEMIAWECPTI